MRASKDKSWMNYGEPVSDSGIAHEAALEASSVGYAVQVIPVEGGRFQVQGRGSAVGKLPKTRTVRDADFDAETLA